MLDLDEGEQTEQGGFADEELPADESELGKELLRLPERTQKCSQPQYCRRWEPGLGGNLNNPCEIVDATLSV